MWLEGGCAWPGVACMARGDVWLGECMVGGAWLWACVLRGKLVHGTCMEGKNGHCSGRYTSYWNALLFEKCGQ